LIVANALAYFDKKHITALKFLIVQSNGINIFRLVFFVGLIGAK